LIYILFGPDDFSLREKLAELKKELGDSESLAINTNTFEGSHLTVAQLVSACNTIPFLATNRLVVVEGLLSRFEQKTGGRDPGWDEWKSLNEHASNMPPTTVLMLIDGKIGRGNPLLKRIAPISKVWEFPLLKSASLQNWIRSRVAKCEGSISPRAVKLLTELAGENLWVLAGEIDKLCLYARGRRIEEEDIRQATSYAREASIFALVDAIVEKKHSAAMRLLHQSLAEGMAPTYILFMLARQLRLIVGALEVRGQGTSLIEKREYLGLSLNYPIEKLLEQSAGYPMPRLVEVYEKLLETDMAIKTGKWKDDLALDLLVAHVCC
jgi:DNA polymerase-3 subunit delta